MKKKSITLEDLKEKYKTKGFELSLILGFYRFEIFLTNTLLKSNISANQVTTISFVLGMLGCALFSSGQQFLMYLGITLIIAWAFLDYIDGNIARAKGTIGNVGFFLDLISSHVVGVFTLLSMGIAIANSSIDQGQSMLSRILPGSLLLDPLIIALAGALAYAMKRFLKAYFLLIIGDNKTETQFTHSKENSRLTRRNVLGKTYYILRGLIEFPRSYTLVVLASLLLDKLYIWVYLVSLAFILSAVAESARIMKRVYTLSREDANDREKHVVTDELAEQS